ncbi:hypothetical protein GGF46_000588 [Coemansia sp. RSA 552]|nr:hypothetical protein GGF46_000588 [Coemansia sp. RSA 552]
MDRLHDSEKLLEDGAAPATVPRRPARAHPRRNILAVVAKAALLLAAALVVLAVCMYADTQAVLDAMPAWMGGGIDRNRERPAGGTEKLLAGDCRSSGCRGDFECVQVDANIACFVSPCPSTLYMCVPPGAANTPDAAFASILPIGLENGPVMAQPSPAEPDETHADAAAVDGDAKVTEAFYSCVLQHGNRSSWLHADSCNTCRCTPTGGVACTRKLCIPASKTPEEVKQALNQAGNDIHTTVIVPMDGEEGGSAVYTSVAIDVQA